MKFNIELRTIEEVKKFCDCANDVNCDMYLRQGRYVVNAKSIMGVFSLDLLNKLEFIIDEPRDDFYDFFAKIKELGIICTD